MSPDFSAVVFDDALALPVTGATVLPDALPAEFHSAKFELKFTGADALDFAVVAWSKMLDAGGAC